MTLRRWRSVASVSGWQLPWSLRLGVRGRREPINEQGCWQHRGATTSKETTERCCGWCGLPMAGTDARWTMRGAVVTHSVTLAPRAVGAPMRARSLCAWQIPWPVRGCNIGAALGGAVRGRRRREAGFVVCIILHCGVVVCMERDSEVLHSP